VYPSVIVPTIDRDPDDDQVLAAAVAASADWIVSGDAHLLDLERHGGIDIVSASTAMQRIDALG
jgi:predicted nucleic acid-binding protein